MSETHIAEALAQATLPASDSSPAPATETDAEREARERLKAAIAAASDNWRTFIRDAGPRLSEARFKTFASEPGTTQRAAIEAVEDWAWHGEASSLVLFGTCGTGKDHLALSAARVRAAERHSLCVWQSGRSWFGKLRNSFTTTGEASVFEPVVNADLLVLSDPLPVQGAITDWQADALFRLLDERWRHNRTNIITVNVQTEAEADARFTPTVWDRITQDALLVACLWPSHRQPSRRVNC